MSIYKITTIKPVGKGGAGQLDYLNDTSEDKLNYFSKDDRAEFYGKAAERLNIAGAISDFDQVKSLGQGYNPNDKSPLVKDAGADHRQGIEFAFNAAKTVSVVSAIGTKEQQEAVNKAHRAALKKTLDYIESELFKGRKGAGGIRKTEAECIFAVFHHDENRDLDMHLHSHVVAMNVGYSEGKFGTLEMSAFYEARLTAGQMYQNYLGEYLMESGFAIELKTDSKRGVQVEIAGVPDELCNVFEKRQKSIDSYINDNNLADTRANRQIANLATRKAKDKTITKEELENIWLNEAAKAGYTPERLSDSIAAARSTIAEKALKDIECDFKRKFISDVLEKHGTRAKRKDLLMAALESGCGNITVEQIRELEEKHYGSDDVIKLGNGCIATKELITREEKVLAFGITKSKRNSIDKQTVEKSCQEVERKSGRKLNGEQLEAVYAICGRSENIVCIQGKAGTGKSTLLEAAVAAAKAEGRKVYGTATAGKAATGLEEAGMSIVENTAKLLSLLKKNKIKFQKGDFVIIDEAGMMNTEQFSKLASFAEKAKAKLISVGDYEQLQAIGAGGMHKLLCEKIGCVELRQVFRQKDSQEAEAGLMVSDGKANAAISLYRDKGRYFVCDTKADMSREIAKMLANTATPYTNKFAVADTRAQGRDISTLVQKIREAKGEVGKGVSIKIVDPNEEESEISQRFAVGDRIAFFKAAKKDNRVNLPNGNLAKVQNGHFGTITDLREREDGSFDIHVNHDKLGDISFNSGTYNTFALGYAGTLHKSQGATLEECFWGTDAPDKHKGYVAFTRHTKKDHFYLFTTKEADEQLAAKMSQANYNLSALEALESVREKSRDTEAKSIQAESEQKPKLENGLQADKAIQQKAKPKRTAHAVKKAKPQEAIIEKGLAWIGEACSKTASATVNALSDMKSKFDEMKRKRAEQEKIKREEPVFKYDLQNMLRNVIDFDAILDKVAIASSRGYKISDLTNWHEQNVLHIAASIGPERIKQLRKVVSKEQFDEMGSGLDQFQQTPREILKETNEKLDLYRRVEEREARLKQERDDLLSAAIKRQQEERKERRLNQEEFIRATKQGDTASMRRCLEHGADISIPDSSGRTAIDFARSKEAHELILEIGQKVEAERAAGIEAQRQQQAERQAEQQRRIEERNKQEVALANARYSRRDDKDLGKGLSR